MSWDVYVAAPLVDGGTALVAEWNYTHNCNGMIRAAGWPEWWSGVNGTTGADVAARLDVVIGTLEADPERWREMNPENGWGSYDSLLPVLREMRSVALAHPSSTWRCHG